MNENYGKNWETSTAPTDGTVIVVIASISRDYGKEGYTEPVCAVIYYNKRFNMWLHYSDDLAVCEDSLATFRIFNWIEYPF